MEVEPEPQQQQTTSSRQLSPEELVLLKAEEAAILAELAALDAAAAARAPILPTAPTDPDPSGATAAAGHNRARRAAALGGGNTADAAVAAPERPVEVLRQHLVEVLGAEAVAATVSTSFSLQDDACLARYLRARKGNIAAAAQLLQDTLQWRAEFGVDRLAADCWPIIETEAADGKVFVSPTGRSCGAPTRRPSTTRGKSAGT